jgi:hypothetical protein
MKRMMLSLALLATAAFGCGTESVNVGSDLEQGADVVDQADVVDVAEQGDLAVAPDQIDLVDTVAVDANDVTVPQDDAVEDGSDAAMVDDVSSDINVPEVTPPAVDDGLQYNGAIRLPRGPK